MFPLISDNDTTAKNPMVAKYQEELDPEDQVSIGSLNEFNTTAKQTVDDIMVEVINNNRNNESENELEKTITNDIKRPIFPLNTLDKAEDRQKREPVVAISASTATPTDTSEVGSESGSVRLKQKVKTKKKVKSKKKSSKSGDEEQRRLEEFLGPDISHDTLTYEQL